MYAEYMPTSSRGRAVMTLQFFWAIGAVFLAILAWAVMPTLGWRYLLALSTIPLGIFVIMGPKLLPESPMYLATTGQKDRVENELKKVRIKYVIVYDAREWPAGIILQSNSI